MEKSNIEEFYLPLDKNKTTIPLLNVGIPAGFASPADDYVESQLDFNAYLIEKPLATFAVKVTGNSMEPLIMAGDIIIVDKSRISFLEAMHDKIVVAALDGEFFIKRLVVKDKTLWLYSENPEYLPKELKKSDDFVLWGVATGLVRKLY